MPLREKLFLLPFGRALASDVEMASQACHTMDKGRQTGSERLSKGRGTSLQGVDGLARELSPPSWKGELPGSGEGKCRRSSVPFPKSEIDYGRGRAFWKAFSAEGSCLGLTMFQPICRKPLHLFGGADNIRRICSKGVRSRLKERARKGKPNTRGDR